jgi:hypothetical protein
MKSNHRYTFVTFLSLCVVAIVIGMVRVYPARATGPYAPGATLDPQCTPGTTGCTVALPTFSPAGDLTGSSTFQTVIGLQGNPIATTTPTSSQVLAWNGSAWIPTTQSNASGSTSTYSGVTSDGANGLNVSGTVAAETSIKTPEVNQQFDDGGWAFPCTYNAVTYYTEPDCAFYGVLNWIVTNNASGATLVFGNGVFQKCAEWIGNTPSSTSPYQISLKGQGEYATVIQQISGSVSGHSCSLGSNPMILMPASTGGTISRYNLDDMQLNPNDQAGSIADLLGTNYEGHVTNVLGYCAINGTEDHCMQMSGPSASPQNEWWAQDQVSITLEPQGSKFGSGATVSSSVSGGTITFNLTSGGTGYTDPTLYIDGYGTGPTPCATLTAPTLTEVGGVVQSISGTYGTGCVGPVYAYVKDGTGQNYGLKMPYFTDSKPSSFTGGGGDAIADLFVGGGNNTWIAVHPTVSTPAEMAPYGIYLSNASNSAGAGHFYGTNCGEVMQYCFYMTQSAQIEDSQYFNEFPVAGLSYAYVASTNETDLNGLICSGSQTKGDWHAFVTSQGPVDSFANHQLIYGNTSSMTAENINNCNNATAGLGILTDLPAAGNDFNLFSQSSLTWVKLGTWVFNTSTPEISYGSLNIAVTASLNGGAATHSYITVLPGMNAAAPNLSGGILIENDSSSTSSNDTILAAAMVDTTGGGSTSNNSFDLYVELAAHVTGTYSVTHGQYDSWTSLQSTESNPGGASATVYPLTLTHGITDATVQTLPNGSVATTQTSGDNSTKIATDAFVLANAGGSGNGSSSGCSANYYPSSVVGTSNSPLSQTANHVQGWAFIPECSITFSNIYAIASTADASNSYSMAIANSSGSLICHPTTGLAVPSTNSLMTNTCSEGSVSLAAGQVYILLTTGNSGTGTVKATPGDSLIGAFYSLNVTGCTSTSGVISGTCSITLAPTVYSGFGIPTFQLH